MAITNYERVGKAMELLKDGLIPFVERELKSQYAQQWIEEAKTSVSDTQAKLFVTKDKPQWDIASILSVIWNKWELVFRKTLGRAELSIVSELREVRNKWAHQNPFSGDDTDRALDSAERLLSAVSAPQADEVRKIKMELRRTIYDEQVRTRKTKKREYGNRKCNGIGSETLAGSGDAASRCSQRQLPAGRICGGFVAGAYE